MEKKVCSDGKALVGNEAPQCVPQLPTLLPVSQDANSAISSANVVGGSGGKFSRTTRSCESGPLLLADSSIPMLVDAPADLPPSFKQPKKRTREMTQEFSQEEPQEKPHAPHREGTHAESARSVSIAVDANRERGVEEKAARWLLPTGIRARSRVLLQGPGCRRQKRRRLWDHVAREGPPS